FNAHQRRTVGGRSLLGPDAVDAAVEAFARRGLSVLVRSSPWRLGADQADLASEWFTGWVAAACEQRPEVAGPARAYVSGRVAAGRRWPRRPAAAAHRGRGLLPGAVPERHAPRRRARRRAPRREPRPRLRRCRPRHPRGGVGADRWPARPARPRGDRAVRVPL